MARANMHVTRLARLTPASTAARWICTCGRQSKLFGYAGHAEGAGRHHARTVGGFWLDEPARGPR